MNIQRRRKRKLASLLADYVLDSSSNGGCGVIYFNEKDETHSRRIFILSLKTCSGGASPLARKEVRFVVGWLVLVVLLSRIIC